MQSLAWHNSVLILHKPIFMQHTTFSSTYVVLLTITCAMMAPPTLASMVILTLIGLKNVMVKSQPVPMSCSLPMVQSPGVPRKQQIVSLSSTEAEYITLSQAVTQASWYHTFLDELSFL